MIEKSLSKQTGADISYRKNWGYTLLADYVIQTQIFPERNIYHPFVTLTKRGLLKIRDGYSWDGMTCFPDFKSCLRGSLGHDGKYQLMREGLLDRKWRRQADIELGQDCREDGFPLPIVVFCGTNWFGGWAAK